MRIAEVCRYIEAHADTKLPLAALAQRAQLSPFHFQRRFKAIVGLSPKDYSEACRLQTLRRELRADRKSVVSGTSVSVRVDIGGRRIITKNSHQSSRNITESLYAEPPQQHKI